jgi:hypothetical protein
VARRVGFGACNRGPLRVPTELLDAFTRNLFRDGGATRLNDHPFDDLTSILKRAKELTVGTKGFSPKAEREAKRENDGRGNAA